MLLPYYSEQGRYWGLLALLLRARTLLGAPGLTTRSKDAIRSSWPYYYLTTRSKDATGGSWPYYYEQGRY